MPAATQLLGASGVVMAGPTLLAVCAAALYRHEGVPMSRSACKCTAQVYHWCASIGSFSRTNSQRLAMRLMLWTLLAATPLQQAKLLLLE